MIPPEFIQRRMRKSQKAKYLTPARVQAALALLEKLRESPSLRIEDHLANPGSAGLKSHESFGDGALARFNLPKINANHGRRSSNLREWGPELLDLLRNGGFESAPDRSAIIEAAQTQFADALRTIIEQDPLEVTIPKRSAESVIRDVLDQADEKGRAGDVAQYLVGAKLMLRFEMSEISQSRSSRRTRATAKTTPTRNHAPVILRLRIL